MKPVKETGSPEVDSGKHPGARRFLSGMAWFLAAIGIIVGVVGIAQHEVPMDGINPESVPCYSYWSVFKFSGPWAMLSFLFMFGSLASVSFRQNIAGMGRPDWACRLPLVLGSGMAFFLLTGAWQGTTAVGIDAGEPTRYLILESKLQILVGATSSLLCHLITRLRRRAVQPAQP